MSRKRRRKKRMDPKVFRLAIEKHKAGCSANRSGKEAGMSESTGLRWINRMDELGLTAEQVSLMSDKELKGKIWKPMGPNPANRYPFDVEAVGMQVLNGMTIQECFEAYQAEAKEAKAQGKTELEPIKRTQFNDKVRAKLKELKGKKREMRTQAKTGDEMEIDTAGDLVKVPGPDGKFKLCKVLVAVLRATKFTYAGLMADGTTASWNQAIVGALKAFGGVPRHIVIDNDVALVSDATRGAQKYVQEFEDLCNYYGMDIAPARVGEPRDKGLVESTVRIIENQFIKKANTGSIPLMPSMVDYQRCLDNKVGELNKRTMKVYGCSRQQDFDKRERNALKKLPEGEFTPFGPWYVRTIRKNGCVQFEGHFYLTDPNYPPEKIRLRAGPDGLLHFASMNDSGDLWTYRHFEKGEPDPLEGFNHLKPEFRTAWEVTPEAQLQAAAERLGKIGENAKEYANLYVEKHKRKQKRATADQLNYLARQLEKEQPWAANLACEQAVGAGYLKNDIVLAYLKVIKENPNFKDTKTPQGNLEGACLRSPEEFAVANAIIFGKCWLKSNNDNCGARP